MTSIVRARLWLTRGYVMIVCGGVDKEAGGTNGDIAADDDDGDLEDRPRVDERPKPLDDRLLDPPEDLP